MCVYVLKGGVSCYSTYKTIVLRSATSVAILVQICCSFLVINTKSIDLKFCSPCFQHYVYEKPSFTEWGCKVILLIGPRSHESIALAI